VGAVADLVVLNADDPMLAGHSEASLLDALVFSGYRLPIERVMVNGEWRVLDGDHVDRAETSHAYAETLRRIANRCISSSRISSSSEFRAASCALPTACRQRMTWSRR
jgi:hypothetical protein